MTTYVQTQNLLQRGVIPGMVGGGRTTLRTTLQAADEPPLFDIRLTLHLRLEPYCRDVTKNAVSVLGLRYGSDATDGILPTCAVST
jgi:hypothetical protein